MESDDDERKKKVASVMEGLPNPIRFYEHFVLAGLRVELIQPGRILCSLKLPSRFLNINNNNSLHGGATVSLLDFIGLATLKTLGSPTAGVSLEINLSYFHAAYLHEEIEIDSKVVQMGKTIAVINVDLSKKGNPKTILIAQARLIAYLLPFPSNL